MNTDQYTNPVAKRLARAAEEVLKPDGWMQGSFGAWERPDGCVCAAGAIRRVSFQDTREQMNLSIGERQGYIYWTDLYMEARFWVHTAFLANRFKYRSAWEISRAFRDNEPDLARWNDKRGRTAKQVAQLLTEAADLAENGGK